MAKKQGLQYGYAHVRHLRRKRPGRHAKKYGKRISRRKRTRGQGN